MRCFSTRLLGAAKRIPMKKTYRGPAHEAVQAWKVKVRHWSKTFRALLHAMRFMGRMFMQGFFLLHAAKVRSSFEEGPGQSALQSAYPNPQLDVNELKQQNNLVIQAKNCKQQINKLNRRRRWQCRWSKIGARRG